MVKYLALAKVKGEIIGICFFDSSEKSFELSIVSSAQINSKIEYYQTQGVSQILHNNSYNFSTDIMEIRNNFLNLPFFQVNGISELEKEIVAGIGFIFGLERKRVGFYPEYYFAGKKINQAVKRALFTMYLYEPWKEIGQVKFGEHFSFIPHSLKTFPIQKLSVENSPDNNY